MGCQFFAGMKYGRGVTPDFNMDTTLNGFLLLFVIATGDGFSAVVRDARVSPPECTVCTACKVGQELDVILFRRNLAFQMKTYTCFNI